MPSMTGGAGLNTGLLAKLGAGPRVGQDLAKTSAGLGRGPNRGKTLNAAPWSQTWPAPSATLDLDFANDRGYVRGVGQGRSMDAVTFTRASNGNYVKPDGTLSSHANQGALGNNLLTFPQDFDNAAWTVFNTTVTQNATIAPDGTNTSEALFETTTNAGHSIYQQTVSTSAVQVFASVFIKPNGRNYAFLRTSNNGGPDLNAISVDLVNGTATNVLGTTNDILCSLEPNGFYRVGFRFTGHANIRFEVITSQDGVYANRAYAGDVTKGIYIWGAQLEVGSTATEYFPTNINTPRFDWASTAQVTQNLLLRTEEFDNAAWTKSNVTVTANSAVAPDGNTTANTITANGSNSFIYQTLTLSNNTTYTLSIYVKTASVNTTLNLALYGNLGSTTIGSVSFTTTGDWQRISLTANTRTLSGTPIFGIGGASSFSTGETLYIWGAQLELGDTATTYIANGAYSATNTPLAANPTCNGLLIEESRANRLLWNRDATQTQWTKTNVTAAKDQTGIDGVANAASSLTASADGGTCIQTITLASGSRTGSVYLKRITGTGNVQVTLDGSTWSTVDLSASEWRRIVLSGTVTNPTVGIRLAVNGDAVAMDYGQIEDGAFPTSPILTTTATATRSADIASLLVAQWMNTDKGTVVAKITPGLGTNGTNRTILAASGTRVFARIGTVNNVVITGPSTSANTNNVTGAARLVDGVQSTIATGYLRYKLAACFSSTTVETNSNDMGLLVPTISVAIGSYIGSIEFINSTLSRITYIPAYQSVDVLKDLASPT